MKRTRLVLLFASALLSTSIQSFDTSLIGHAGVAADTAVASELDPFVNLNEDETVLYAEGDAARDANSVARPTEASDDALLRPISGEAPEALQVAAILKRLSIRHTGLSTHERETLARTILDEARAQSLEPELVIAVIEVESAGYHLAVSHVGAMGLMQLLPSTGEEVARKHGIEWSGDDTLFDPTINVKLGTAYLRQLADRYGDVQIALAAYNWGPGRIDRRLRRGATVPSLYIQQVMRAYGRNMTVASTRS